MRKSVGYFEGTDSTLLTALVCEGYDTLPVSNGYDSHGSHVRLINDQNRYDLLVGYLHKIYAPEEHDPTQPSYQDVFHICRTYGIPLLLEVQPDIVEFVDPSEMLDTALKILESG